MRAYAVQHYGDAPAIVDVPVPAPTNAYVVRVTYAGVDLAAGSITARIAATEPLDAAGALLESLRHGTVHGKAVIRVQTAGGPSGKP